MPLRPAPVASPPATRQRLPREARTRQLLDVAWTMIRAAGTDELTLGRLAEAAGVTKPVAYDHFATRNGLLAALYEDYDARQTLVFDAAVDAAPPTLDDKARAVADSYVDCVLSQGHEISAVVAALSGSTEMREVKRRYQQAFIAKCQRIFAPFAAGGHIEAAGMWAVLGAGDTVSDAAMDGDITRAQAKDALRHVILSVCAQHEEARPAETAAS